MVAVVVGVGGVVVVVVVVAGGVVGAVVVAVGVAGAVVVGVAGGVVGVVGGVVVVAVAVVVAVVGAVVLNKKGTNHELSSRGFFSNGSFCCGCSDRHAAAISYRDRRGYWRLFFVLML